jgi:hypothetical protein
LLNFCKFCSRTQSLILELPTNPIFTYSYTLLIHADLASTPACFIIPKPLESWYLIYLKAFEYNHVNLELATV